MNKVLFGQRLKQARKAKGIQRGEFAAALDVSYTMVGHYEAGRNVPSVDRLIQIASLVGQPLDWILGISEDGFSRPPDPAPEATPRRRKKRAQATTSGQESGISTPSSDPPSVPAF